MFPVLRTLVHLTMIGALLCPSVVLAQEEEEGSSLENLLRGALEDLVEDQMGGQLGRVRRVEVVEKSQSEVVLEVQLRGVDDPDAADLAVELYDHQLKMIEGVEIDFEPLPQGDGSTTLRVHYAGDGRIFSSAIQVSLVDADTGRPSSHRKKDLAWEWIGSGDWSPSSSGGGSSSELAPSRTETGDEREPRREPRVVALTPSRIGDTPRYSASSGSSGSGRGSTLIRPRKTPRPATGRIVKPTPTPRLVLAQPLVMYVAPAVDLYKEGLKAAWSSGAGKLKINDKSADRKGFARLLGKKALHDNKQYEKVIELHPQWIDNGHIRGAFKIKVPNKASKFEAKAGFLSGVTRTNGVRVTVTVGQGSGAKTLLNRVVARNKPVTTLSAQIPKQFWNRSTVLTITVRANGHSTQDWFALSTPGIY